MAEKVISTVFEIPNEPFKGGAMPEPRYFLSGFFASGEFWTTTSKPDYVEEDHAKLVSLVDHRVETGTLELKGETKDGAPKLRFALSKLKDLGLDDPDEPDATSEAAPRRGEKTASSRGEPGSRTATEVERGDAASETSVGAGTGEGPAPTGTWARGTALLAASHLADRLAQEEIESLATQWSAWITEGGASPPASSGAPPSAPLWQRAMDALGLTSKGPVFRRIRAYCEDNDLPAPLDQEQVTDELLVRFVAWAELS